LLKKGIENGLVSDRVEGQWPKNVWSVRTCGAPLSDRPLLFPASFSQPLGFCMVLPFDAAPTEARIEKFWQLSASFGMERNAYHNYLNEIVSDRYTLIHGLQILRDELQFAASSPTDMKACGADMSLPSVVTTLAYTNCGDRIHQGEATKRYRDVVASRFATLSEIGELKLEAFFPAGGGTDNGATLAHVTVAHELDEPLKRRVYDGNPQSISLVAFAQRLHRRIDLKTHVGRLRENGQHIYGKTRESPWREPRDACGAFAQRLHRRIAEIPYKVQFSGL